MLDTKDILRRLSMASGLSGYEADVGAIIRETMEAYADEVRSDAMGNLIAVKRGSASNDSRHTIMLAAHMDEIGLMVTDYDGAFLRFANVGGVDVRTIIGQEVVVHGRRPLTGIVASRPPHVLSAAERQEAVPLKKLFIDVGLPEDELRQVVQIGDLISMKREFVELSEDFVSGKAFDDRAGVASVLVCLEALSGMRHAWDVYAVATTQEELGLRGATTSAFGIAPDIAIAIDVGFGTQTDVKASESIAMDGGPAVAMGPNVHPLMHERLVSTAKKYEIKCQTEVASGPTGTDAWAIQVTREGIPTALLSIPLRYMHTSVETLKIADIDRTGRLMARMIAELDQEFAETLGLEGGEL